MKIKLCTHFCAGKTHFIIRNKGTYRGIRLIDFDVLKYEEMYRHGLSLLEVRQRRFRYSAERLLSLPNDTCLLGDAEEPGHPDIRYVGVIPPREIVKRNVESRQKHGKLTWSVPDQKFCIATRCSWFLMHLRTVLYDRTKARAKLNLWKIPTFDTFEAALDSIIDST